MQLLLPSSVNFQVSPSDVNFDSLVRKMYQPKRAILYPRSPYAARELLKRHSRAALEGLGFSYYDLLNQAGLEDCDPKDTTCTLRNNEKQIAVEDLWVSQYMTHPDTANQPTPQISIATDTSPAALQRYLQNQPETTETIAVGGGPAYSAGQYESTYYTPPAPAPTPKPNQSVPPTTPLTPMQTGFQSTAQALVNQAAANQTAQQQGGAAGSGGGSSQQTGDGKILGIDQKTFLIGAAIVGGVLLLGGKK